MTKAQLIERFATETKTHKVLAERLVNGVLDAMEGAMKRGEHIEIRGFGSFDIRAYGPYRGRNPATGKHVDVQRKLVPFFKCGKELKTMINRRRGA